MKKQILMLAAIFTILFFSYTKKDNMKKIESPGIIAEDEVSTIDRLVIYRIPVSNYSNILSTSSGNCWKTYLLPD